MFRALLAALCLSACGSLPSGSFDPIRDNPAEVVVAARLEPAPVGTPAATMRLEATRPDGLPISATFDLEALPRPATAPAPAQLFYGLAPGDVARLTRTRSRIAASIAVAPATVGEFSVDLEMDRTDLDRVTIWLSPKAGQTFELIADESL